MRGNGPLYSGANLKASHTFIQSIIDTQSQDGIITISKLASECMSRVTALSLDNYLKSLTESGQYRILPINDKDCLVLLKDAITCISTG
jgi:hypothetical protein